MSQIHQLILIEGPSFTIQNLRQQVGYLALRIDVNLLATERGSCHCQLLIELVGTVDPDRRAGLGWKHYNKWLKHGQDFN